MSLALGLDVGTQSVKLLAYDPVSRRVVAAHGEPLELIAGDDGSREQHAEWWITAIRACFAQLDPALRGRVSAVGVSGQQARLRAARCQRRGTGTGQAVVRHQH